MRLYLLILLLVLSGRSPLMAQGSFLVEEEQLVLASDAAPGRAFGESLDVSGDLAIVGSPGEGAYVLRREGGAWVEAAKLVPPPGLGSMALASAVAIQGDTAFVADPESTAAGPLAGGVVFVFQSTVSGAWAYQGVLGPMDSERDDGFGHALDVEGSTLVVGAWGKDLAEINTGAVYVFERAGNTWTQRALLTSSDGGIGDRFGTSVALAGDRLAVGAHLRYGQLGARGGAYVFEQSQGLWSETAILEYEPIGVRGFGWAVDLHGDRLAVGAPLSLAQRGTAHVFELQGSAWIEVAALTHPSPVTLDFFGRTVALGAEWLAIGSPKDQYAGGNGVGSVWMAIPKSGGWGVEKRVVPSVQQPQCFGASLALEDRNLLVGAPAYSGFFGDQGAVLDHTLFPIHGETYCESTASSTGVPANLWTTGSTSLDAKELVFWAGPVPDRTGLFFFGDDQANQPFGNGVRCVGGAELYRLSPALANQGVLRHTFDWRATTGAGGPVVPGSTWNFQAWFRDPLAGGAGFDLSSATSLLFFP